MPENFFKQIIEDEKSVIKADVRLLLNKISSLTGEENSEKHQALISSIYNELDKYNLQDMLAWRKFIAENLDTIIASKTERTLVSSVTNMKVVSDAAGNYFVTGTENGAEKIIYQTDDKAKAEEFAKQSTMASTIIAADEEDVTNADNAESLETDEFDSIPSEKAAVEDDVVTEKEDIEDETVAEEDKEADLIEQYDTIIDDIHSFLDEIANVINEVPDLRPITELAQIKAEVSDIVEDLENTKISTNVVSGSANEEDEKELISKLSDSKKVLEALETKVLNIINKYSDEADAENATVASDIAEDIENTVSTAKEEKSEVVDETEKELTENLDDQIEEVNAEELKEFNAEEPEEVINEEKIDDYDYEEEFEEDFDEEFEEDFDEDLPAIEDDNFDEESLSDEKNADIKDLVDELVGMTTISGDKVEKFNEKLNDINEAINNMCSKFEDETLDTDLTDAEFEQTEDEVNFDENESEAEQIDKNIEDKINEHKATVTKDELLEGVDETKEFTDEFKEEVSEMDEQEKIEQI